MILLRGRFIFCNMSIAKCSNKIHRNRESIVTQVSVSRSNTRFSCNWKVKIEILWTITLVFSLMIRLTKPTIIWYNNIFLVLDGRRLYIIDFARHDKSCWIDNRPYCYFEIKKSLDWEPYDHDITIYINIFLDRIELVDRGDHLHYNYSL